MPSSTYPAAVERPATIITDNHTARLNWLETANAEIERRERLFRNWRDEAEMHMMRDPLPVPRAYARFGLLLGALPVAALFFRLIFHLPNLVPLWPLFLVMEILCAVAGWRMASWLGRKTEASAVQSWHEFVYDAMEAGAMWAVVTGALGGIPFFVVGSFFGALLALPIGIIAFTVFMPLHRLLARGGMIDARHLWPLACGVVATITALILSPEIIPY